MKFLTSYNKPVDITDFASLVYWIDQIDLNDVPSLPWKIVYPIPFSEKGKIPDEAIPRLEFLLHRYACFHFRRLEKRPPERVVLEWTNHWEKPYPRLVGNSCPEEKERVFGYFWIQHQFTTWWGEKLQGSDYVEWTSPSLPRLPTPQEEKEHPSKVKEVLKGLTAAPGDKRWQDGESHVVCGLKVQFVLKGG